MVALPGACSHTAECILPVVVPAAAATTKLLAGHGMIDVAALHMLTTVTRHGWDARVGACGSQAKLTTANNFSVRSFCFVTIDRGAKNRSFCSTYLFGCNVPKGKKPFIRKGKKVWGSCSASPFQL